MLALVDAVLARQGVEEMGARARAAAELLPDESPWMTMCCLLDGTALYLRGFGDEARERLAEGARRGAVGAPSLQVLCLTQLALLAIDEDDWQLAEMLTSQARAQVERSGMEDHAIMALALAVSGLVRSRTGRVEMASADLQNGRRLLRGLDEFGPWYEAETRIVLAQTAARFDDVPSARGLLDDAARWLKLTPDATVLGEWIEQTEARIETVSASAVKDLTPAELRMLQFLPTHLSFPQIAAQLYLSPNTVKSQVQSVYRKLDVSSRRGAVERARGAGLLDGAPRPGPEQARGE